MNLFEFNEETGLPDIDPIVSELKPFKKIFSRDRSKYKQKARAELAFVWFYTDYKSDFSTELNEEKKVSEIVSLLSLSDDWIIDKTISNAIKFYKDITKTPSTVLLNQTKRTINKLSDFLETMDFTEVDSSGKLKYDMKKIIDTTNQIPQLIVTLREIEMKVKEEQETLNKKIKGGKILEALEDGIPED